MYIDCKIWFVVIVWKGLIIMKKCDKQYEWYYPFGCEDDYTKNLPVLPSFSNIIFFSSERAKVPCKCTVLSEIL